MAKNQKLAVEEGRALVKLYPDWTSGYLALGRILVSKGDLPGAKALLANAVKHLPDQPALLSAYARMLVEAKELPLAYEYFTKLSELAPDDESASYWLGLISVELKKNVDAKRHFKRLLELNKRPNAAAFFLGRVAESEKQTEQAIGWYQRVERGEYHEQAQLGLVRLWATSGQLAQAREWLKGLRIQQPKQAVRFYLMEADLLQEFGDAADTMELFNQSLQAYPDANELLYARGLFAATLEQLDVLEQDMNRVLQSDPENADALNALGYTLADQTDRYAEALELITRALAIKPDAPAVLDSMGWVQYRLGNIEESLEYLQRAYKKLPDPEIAAHLGEVLWVMGNQSQADEVWQSILIVTPDSKHVLETMNRLKR
jgi:tetratricopeptide (TPR) repeat protein